MNSISKLAWPVVVIIVLVLFQDQIGSQFDRLSGVKISGTEFSVVLQNTASSKNQEATYDIIKGLNREGIIALLQTGDSIQLLTYDYSDGDDNSVRLVENFGGFLELQRNELTKPHANLELFHQAFQSAGSNGLRWALTQAGIQDIEIELNDKGTRAWYIIAESVNTALNP